MTIDNHTITAIATPEGVGALAVIRISGSDAFSVFRKCIKEKVKFDRIKEKTIELFTFLNEDETIDEITAIKYVSPKSFTGEDMIEIICHGGRVTVNEIMKVLLKSGSKIAQRGEFTKRAFNNGKLDLLKAEAIKGIIESTSVFENKIALNSYYGSSKKSIEKLKNTIIELICDIESSIEFAEEDDIKEISSNTEQIDSIIKYFEKEVYKRNRIKEVGKGIKVLIAGPPNAGKSTLYNKILGYNRSIINEEAGTTRDLITEKIEVNKKNVTIIDSAGIRITDNSIEKEGIKRSEEAIEESSILIWITSSNEIVTEEEIRKIEEIKSKRTIFIINKADTNSNVKEVYFLNKGITFIKISLNIDSIEIIEKEIIKNVDEITNTIEINEFVINERHEIIVEDVLKKLYDARLSWRNKEIASIYLNEALKEIENFTGKIGTDEIINTIFDKFCIGK